MSTQPLPRIVKLEEAVINRIAAGEVVQRPANAIKELLENSLDAGSTNVQIVIKQGGLKLLQIQDNGHGIAETDMPLVCERFTTSKLRKFEDLSQIATFGFRGEALASISHVARVTITTKTAGSQCAYRATFTDGKMTSELTFTAGNTGTQILAEDLFYNMATRKAALQNFTEETRRICEVVQKYAVHNYKVAVSLRRFDENVPDVRTSGGANSQAVDAIRMVYGNDVAKNLLPELTIEDPKLAFSARSLCSTANYAGKKFLFLLFINNRLVECVNLKRAIEQIYSVYLPKNACPFVYLSLLIAPQNLDVNVHPTKQQVHFLFEDEIVEMIKRTIDSALASTNSSRTFKVETFTASAPSLTLASEERKQRATAMTATPYQRPSSASSSTPAQHAIIRVDSAQQKLDRFFNTKQPRTSLPPSSAERTRRPSSAALMEGVEESGIFATPVQPRKVASSLEKLDDDISFYVKPDKKETEKSSTASETDDDAILNSAYEMMEENVDENVDGENEEVESDGEKKSEEPQLILEQKKPSNVAGSKNSGSKAKPQPSVTVKVSSVPVLAKSNSVTSVANERPFQKRNIQLDSITALKEETENSCHDGLARVFANFAFVGCIDYNYSLIQHDARLLLVNNAKLTSEFFYQVILSNFGNMGYIRFNEPLCLKELALVALDAPHSGWKESDGAKDDLAIFCRDFLISKSSMLLDYFSIEIDTNSGCLLSLPLVIADYQPNFAKLPFFILKLASDVNWESERECFQTICMELAKFYAVGGMPPLHQDSNERQSSGSPEALNDPDFKKSIEHAVFFQIKQQILSTFYPSKELSESASVVEITSLHELYKVFERC